MKKSYIQPATEWLLLPPGAPLLAGSGPGADDQEDPSLSREEAEQWLRQVLLMEI